MPSPYIPEWEQIQDDGVDYSGKRLDASGKSEYSEYSEYSEFSEYSETRKTDNTDTACRVPTEDKIRK